MKLAAPVVTEIEPVFTDPVQFHIWLYPLDKTNEALRHVGKAAADPLLEFSWRDAAAVCKRMRFAKSQWKG